MILMLALLSLAPMVMAASDVYCPKAADIAPCLCQQVPNMVPKNFEIICPGIDNARTIVLVVLKLLDTPHFYKFTIRDGTFMFLPQDAFKRLSFMEFEIADSTFNALTDTDRALEGLEGALVALVIKNSTVLGNWDWLALKKLSNLARVQVDVEMDFVSNDISSIEAARRVNALTLSDNQIAHLDDEAFEGFVTARSISLRNNEISSLKRSMFPNPANSLLDLDLGGNQIRHLPPDLFDNMPNLRHLYIGTNNLHTLSEKPFSTIWSQLKFFHAPGNPLTCDCRMLWMTKQTFPRSLTAECSGFTGFKFVKGKKLTDLEATDLWC